MNALIEILIGLVLAIAGVGMLVVPELALFREALITVILGVIPVVVLLVAAVFLMIGVSDMKAGKEEELEIETDREGE